jgi:hypothetical protein
MCFSGQGSEFKVKKNIFYFKIYIFIIRIYEINLEFYDYFSSDCCAVTLLNRSCNYNGN